MNVKQQKRWLTLVVAAVLMVLSLPVGAWAASQVPYIDEKGVKQTAENVTEVTQETTVLNDGWYVVEGSVTMVGRMTVNGDVHLILSDGATLNATDGIEVSGGHALTIYAQSRDAETMGKLIAVSNSRDAAIGSGEKASGDTMITINGGDIAANSNYGGAAIGSGHEAEGDTTVTVNDGYIRAIAADMSDGAAIGSGYAASGETMIIINGGDIDANSNYGGAAIGSGHDVRGNTTITVNSGHIKAHVNEYTGGAAIGGGYAHSNSVSTIITINGGDIKATTGEQSGGAAIGSGAYTSNEATTTITITGGSVNAVSDGNGAGIGNGDENSGSTFSTGENGHAFILASSISDQSGKDKWRGLIIEGNEGQVYGDTTLSTDATIPADTTVTVPANTTLTIADGVTLTNNGRIIKHGTINGTVIGDGTWGVTNVTLPEKLSMTVGNSQPLKATLNPDDATVLDTEWTSTAPDIVEVDERGTLTAKKAGTAIITVTMDGVTSNECIITVSQRPAIKTYDISLPENLEGGTLELSHRFAAAGANVRITALPQDGYKLDTLTVTDSNGETVDLKQTSDNHYTFTMPKSDISIDVVFVKESGEETTLPFTDVPKDAWYYDAIVEAYESGLMAGTATNTFSPLVTTSRGMIVTMLYRLAGEPSLEGEILGYPYEDVNANAYYANAVYWARMNDIVSGYSWDKFGPNDPITREQLAGMLMRYSKWNGQDVSASADLSHFSDADKVSGWAKEVVQWAVAEGLIKGQGDGSLAPQGQASRAQTAAIFVRFVGK